VFSKTFIVILFKPAAFGLLFVIPLQFDEGNFRKDEKFYKHQVAVNIKFCCTQQYSQFIPKKRRIEKFASAEIPIYLSVCILFDIVGLPTNHNQLNSAISRQTEKISKTQNCLPAVHFKWPILVLHRVHPVSKRQSNLYH